MILIRKYIITGQVQGVGFRMFVSRTAGRLTLRGTVRNLSDGSVECIAATDPASPDDRERLQELEQQLRKGPPHSAVESVTTEELNPETVRELPAAFKIS